MFQRWTEWSVCNGNGILVFLTGSSQRAAGTSGPTEMCPVGWVLGAGSPGTKRGGTRSEKFHCDGPWVNKSTAKEDPLCGSHHLLLSSRRWQMPWGVLALGWSSVESGSCSRDPSDHIGKEWALHPGACLLLPEARSPSLTSL